MSTEPQQLDPSTDDPETEPQQLIPTPDDPDVVRLQELHQAVARRIRLTMEQCIEAGEILERIRQRFPARAPKGQGFGDWVEINLGYSRRTAWGYISAYHRRDELLRVEDSTIRQVMGVRSKKQLPPGPGEHEDTDDNTPTAGPSELTGEPPLDRNNEVIVLTPSQEQRAQRMASYLGVDVNSARRYVRDTAPKRRERQEQPTEPTTAKRTIRVPADTDDLISKVAHTTGRSYAVVANELFEIGRKRFTRRHDINEHD